MINILNINQMQKKINKNFLSKLDIFTKLNKQYHHYGFFVMKIKKKFNLYVEIML